MSAELQRPTLRASGRAVRTVELDGIAVRVTSYRVGPRHFCHVDNIEPGAVIGRGSATTAADAEAAALALASLKLCAGAAREIFGNTVRNLGRPSREETR